jgi:hypothetical protein
MGKTFLEGMKKKQTAPAAAQIGQATQRRCQKPMIVGRHFANEGQKVVAGLPTGKSRCPLKNVR